ncbi:inositol monophosphatase [filamentous cyanobacterium CCP5]|nr:inositol monophosphatase [filamentous cyanobacterium CCT1]PSN19546.1 inositol monophosphatase [filamentous cyanobacterium CCP5]
MDSFCEQILAFCQQATGAVGRQLLTDFGQAQADEKADGSLVTTSDRWADQTLRERILKEFPDHGVLSEEVEHIFPDTEWCWIIDPIDGTTNFTRGIPLWGISLGLLYRGTPVFGYVAIPPARQTFHGFLPGDSGLDWSEGAFCNGQPMHTSQAVPGKNQLFSLCARSTAVLAEPFPCKIRMLGVATYNLLTVAAGPSLGAVEATPKIWDIAAVWAIAQAAGASWIALDDQPPFPLTVGRDYGHQPYPTLVSAQADWVETFRPLVQRVVP